MIISVHGNETMFVFYECRERDLVAGSFAFEHYPRSGYSIIIESIPQEKHDASYPKVE